MVETVIEIPTCPMLFLHFHIANVNKQFDIFARPKNNIIISASLNERHTYSKSPNLPKGHTAQTKDHFRGRRMSGSVCVLHGGRRVREGGRKRPSPEALKLYKLRPAVARGERNLNRNEFGGLSLLDLLKQQTRIIYSRSGGNCLESIPKYFRSST